jgi:copper resistance protein C
MPNPLPRNTLPRVPAPRHPRPPASSHPRPTAPRHPRPTAPSPTGRLAVAAATGLLAFLVPAALTAEPAAAHDRLVSSAPAAGSTGPAPLRIRLTMSEDVVKVGSRVVVTGPSGPVTGRLTTSGPDLTESFADRLAPGRYTVTWRAVSSDGHPVSGRFGFTVRRSPGDPSQTPTPTPDPSPSASTAATGPAAASAGPVGSGGSEPSRGTGGRTIALVGSLIGGLGLAAAGLVVARRRSGQGQE